MNIKAGIPIINRDILAHDDSFLYLLLMAKTITRTLDIWIMVITRSETINGNDPGKEIK
jgi:hypothetical protein